MKGTRRLKHNFVFRNEINSRYSDLLTSTDEDKNVSVTSINCHYTDTVKWNVLPFKPIIKHVYPGTNYTDTVFLKDCGKESTTRRKRTGRNETEKGKFRVSNIPVLSFYTYD